MRHATAQELAVVLDVVRLSLAGVVPVGEPVDGGLETVLAIADQAVMTSGD